MSRVVDVNLIANQIIQTGKGGDKNTHDAIKNHFERLTTGLAEYERHQIAWLVNFRLAAPVL